MVKQYGRRLAAGAACVALVAGVAACGGSDNGGSTSSSSSSSSGTSSTTSTASASVGNKEASSGVTDYLKYTGGKAGAADTSKSPVVIGWVNQQGGPSDVGPGATKGAQMAVKYINGALGGIDGHPLQLHTCFTSTAEEQGQTCGQKMANDKAVNVVGVGAVAIGAQSLDATINAQKPMVYGVALGPSDPQNKNGYALFGNGASVSAPFGTFAGKVLHAKTAAVVWPQQPGIEESSAAIVNGAEGNGVKVKRVSWSPNATDLVGPLTAAGGQSADVIIANTDPKNCVNLSKAITQLHIKTPVVSEPLCLDVTVAKALGDIPPWYYGIAQSLPTDSSDPAAVAYMKVAAKYGNAKEAGGDVWQGVAFSEILTIAQWMNKIGADNLSPATIAKQAKAFKGPLAMGAPTLDCGKNPAKPAICNDQTKFYKYEGKGKFTPASGWVRPPQ
jgi:branched-chain amino acid transport system substrate-binding protein